MDQQVASQTVERQSTAFHSLPEDPTPPIVEEVMIGTGRAKRLGQIGRKREQRTEGESLKIGLSLCL